MVFRLIQTVLIATSLMALLTAWLVLTRAEAFGFDVVVDDVSTLGEYEVFGALFQYPTTWGEIRDLKPLIEQVQAQKGLACVGADLLGLTLLTPPGELGADAFFRFRIASLTSDFCRMLLSTTLRHSHDS